MLRNREFRWLLILMTAISLCAVFVVFSISNAGGWVILATVAGLDGIALLYTKKRYRDIEQLSSYLRRIYGGDYTLDIRDNMEGELSILKNEIYKVTLILSKQAEQLRLEKEQLANALSDISHQLKTPLTSMTVMSELLSKDNLDQEKRREFTRNLEIQLDRMEWLLTSLLKLAKLDAGTVEFKKETVSVPMLVKQVVKPLLIPMELKEQSLMIEGEEQVSFLGDFNWTTEALINILKNCIEHTPNGGIISITYEENPLYTKIQILDNGIGIAKEDLPFIFKRFYRGKNASEDSVGIGLAMAKSIIMNQKGDIKVESEKNIGTRFHIKFYKQIT